MPKRTKFRKEQRGTMNGDAKGGTNLDFGSYGLKALESAWVTAQQIEAARIALTRFVKRGGNVYDLGCATATTLLQIHPRLPASARYIGFDNSAEMLVKAREKIVAAGVDRDDVAIVRLRPERFVWWRGWTSGTVAA